MRKRSSNPDEAHELDGMTAPNRPSSNADRKRQFRETARDILHMDKVKRQMGRATDTAGSLARSMEQAYRLGFEDALKGPEAPTTGLVLVPQDTPDSAAMTWTLIPPRTRRTFWSICLAALGRDGRTETPAYLDAITTRSGSLAWQLVVPERQIYEKTVGHGTIVTLIRLGLLEEAEDGMRVILSAYGIGTWNRFRERGGHWPDDLVEKLP